MFAEFDDVLKFALCYGADPELWFPVGEPGTPGYEAMGARARGICALCPVRASCVTYALDIGADDGIFGGLDPIQRRRLAQVVIRPGRVA